MEKKEDLLRKMNRPLHDATAKVSAEILLDIRDLLAQLVTEQKPVVEVEQKFTCIRCWAPLNRGEAHTCIDQTPWGGVCQNTLSCSKLDYHCRINPCVVRYSVTIDGQDCSVRVLILKERGQYVAQGLDYDITAQGFSARDAQSNFEFTFLNQAILDIHDGKRPFEGIKPAPYSCKYGPEEVYIKLDQETALRLQEDHYYEPQRSLTIAHSSSKETKMRRGLWEKDDASRCIKLMRCRSLTAEKGLWNPKHPTGHVPFPIKPWKWYMTNGQGRAQAVLDTCEVDPSFSYVSRIVAVTVDTDKCIFDDYFYATDNETPRNLGTVFGVIGKATGNSKALATKIGGAAQIVHSRNFEKTAKNFKINLSTGAYDPSGIRPTGKDLERIEDQYRLQGVTYFELLDRLFVIRTNPPEVEILDTKLKRFFSNHGPLAVGIASFTPGYTADGIKLPYGRSQGQVVGDVQLAYDFWSGFFDIRRLPADDVRRVIRERILQALASGGKTSCWFYEMGKEGDKNIIRGAAICLFAWQLFVAGKHVGTALPRQFRGLWPE